MDVSAELKAYVPPSFYNEKGDLLVTVSEAEKVAKKFADHVKTLPPEQQEYFMALLSIADLAPVGATIQDLLKDDKLNEYMSRLDNALAKLMTSEVHDFLDLAVDMYQLGELLIQQAYNIRQSELDQRLTARAEATSQLVAQARNMEEASKALLGSALASVVLSVAGGVAGGYAGYKQMGSSTKLLKGLAQCHVPPPLKPTAGKNERVDFNRKMEDFKLELKTAEAESGFDAGKSQMLQAFSMLCQGLAGAANNIGQAESQRLQAAGSLLAALAQEIGAEGDMRKEAQSALEDLIKSIAGALKEIMDSYAESLRSLTQV